MHSSLPFFLFLLCLLQSFRVHLSEVHNVNVCPVHRLDIAHAWVDAEGHGAVDACDGDAVTRLHLVHQVTVGVQDDRVGSLTGRHVL